MTNGGEVEVAITATTSGLQAGMSAAEAVLSSMGPNLFNIAIGIGVAIAAGLGEALHLAGDAERANTALAVALRNTGNASRATLRDLLDYDSGLARHSRFTQDEIVAAQELLVTQGIHGDMLKRTTQAIVDLGTRTGNLTQAATLMGNAYEGSGTGLRKFGIILEEGTPKALMFEQAMAQVEEKFGGRAAADADSLAGSFDKLFKLISLFGEHLGAVTGLAIKDIINYLDAHRDDILKFADDLGKKIVDVMNKLRELVNFLTNNTAVLKGALYGAALFSPGGPLAAGVGAFLGAASVDIYQSNTGTAPKSGTSGTNLKKFKPGNPDGMPEVGAPAGKPLEVTASMKFKAAWLGAYKQVFDGAQVMTQRIAGLMKGFIGSLSSGISGFFRDILVNGKNLGEALQNIGQSMLSFVFDAVAKMLAEWIAKHIIMAAISKLFHLNEVTNSTAAGVAQVAVNKATSLAQIPAIIAITDAQLIQAYSSIPFIGPALSATAIGTANAQIAGFAGLIAAADGGIFDKPTAILGGEAGREAMVPLTGSRGKAALREIGEGAAGASGGGGVNVHITGTFIEGSADKWERLVRNVIVPALERNGRKTRRTKGTIW